MFVLIKLPLICLPGKFEIVAQEMFQATCLHAQMCIRKILSLYCVQNVLGFGESGNKNSGWGLWIRWQQRT